MHRRRKVLEWWEHFIMLEDKEGKRKEWFAPEVVYALVELTRMGL